MANHKSAEKRAKQNKVRNLQNRVKASATRTVIKEVRKAIEEKNSENAKKLFVSAQSLLAKLAKSSAMSKHTASRLTSRLGSQIARL